MRGSDRVEAVLQGQRKGKRFISRSSTGEPEDWRAITGGEKCISNRGGEGDYSMESLLKKQRMGG